MPRFRHLCLVLVVCLALSYPALVNGAEPTPSATPSATTASLSPSASVAQVESRLKQINLWKDGQKAYVEKRYAETFKQLVDFKAANQEIFRAPPGDLKDVVKEISDAITFSQTQLEKKPAVSSGSGGGVKGGRLDGIHWNDHPGTSADKGGRMSGAHDSSGAKAEAKDSGKSSSGASAKERY
jgi:hypothetical protein